MGFTLVLVTIGLAVGLAAWAFFRHHDVLGAVVAVAVAAATFGVWSSGDARRKELEGEIQKMRERIAVLEAVPAKRGFSDDARAAMVDALSSFVGPTAFVLANGSDLETMEYAREIAAILKDAGWNVPPSFGMTYAPLVLPGYEGVAPGLLFGVSSEVPDRFASSVFDVFRDAGVDISPGPHWPGTEHPISILVGPPRRR